MRRQLVVALWLLTFAVWGCAEPTGNTTGSAATQSGTQPANPQTPTGPARLTTGEAATGHWNQSQVETWLKQDLKLSTLTLTPVGEHDFSGTAVTTQGESLRLNVKQVPGGIKCSHDNGRGGSGEIAFGNPVP
jgi:hypothetical protein